MAEPLRVLIMASVRWYNAVAAYALDSACGLRNAGLSVTLVAKPGSPLAERARGAGLPVIPDLDLTEGGPGRQWGNARRLRGWVAEHRPQVVNAHRGEDHTLAAFALRGLGIPLVRTRGDIRPPRTHAAGRWLYQRGTRAHIATADFMPARFYPPVGVDPETVTVIRPGVLYRLGESSLPSPVEARRSLGLDPEGLWVGAVGRLTTGKGQEILLEAVSRLSPTPRVLLSGEETELTRHALEARAAELGIARQLTVRDRGDSPVNLLRALDVLAVPSVASEALSRISLEAMALEVPVAASRLNGIPEIVGDPEQLAEPGNADSLAAVLRRLLGDPGRRKRAVEAGTARLLKRYDPSVGVEKTLKVFRGLVPDPT